MSLSLDQILPGQPAGLDPRSRIKLNKLQKRLRREAGRAIVDYAMIESGDRVMVALSGGKDSFTLLDILISLQCNAPIDFELIAVNLDQKQPGFPEHVLPEQHPGRLESIFRGLQNIAPSQLADLNLFDFTSLERSRKARTDESHVFQQPGQSRRIAR